MLLPVLLQVPPFRHGLTRQGDTPHSDTIALVSLSISAVSPGVDANVKLVIMQPSNPPVVVTVDGKLWPLGRPPIYKRIFKLRLLNDPLEKPVTAAAELTVKLAMLSTLCT